MIKVVAVIIYTGQVSSSTTIIFHLLILVVNVAICHQVRMSKNEGIVVDEALYIMSCYCTALPCFTCWWRQRHTALAITQLHLSNTGLYKSVTRRQRETEYRVVERIERETPYFTEIFPALKVPKHCPLVFVRKLGCRKGKLLGSEYRNELRNLTFVL